MNASLLRKIGEHLSFVSFKQFESVLTSIGKFNLLIY